MPGYLGCSLRARREAVIRFVAPFDKDWAIACKARRATNHFTSRCIPHTYVVRPLVPTIQRSALMPYSAKTMYEIVNNVTAYPSFLPWCGGTKIISHSDGIIEASILMKKGPLNHWFSTRNALTENERIDMSLLDGPFKTLQGAWSFQKIDDESSKIELNLSFEFSSGLATSVLTPIFSQIANTMVDSFCARAREG